MNFAHIVSHNLRSHATNMGMLTGFLGAEKNEDERGTIINMLKDATNSLNDTVMHLNDIINIKINAEEKMSQVNLFNTISTVKKNINQLLKKHKAKCTVRVPKNQVVKAIPAYLESILLNMFTNSLKYHDPARPVCIEIESIEKDENVLVTFKDNGLGIDLKKFGDTLFEMYKTFHNNEDAIGIGLFITKNQVEAMNAKIEVESEVDVGTTFTLIFDTKKTIKTSL